MNRCRAALIAGLLLGLRVCAQSSAPDAATGNQTQRLAQEKKHFLESLAFVYHPALWIRYRDGLFFAPKDETQTHQLELLKTARANYQVLTNRQARHELAAQVIAQSGIEESWRRKILLPYSETNANLTPTLNKPLIIVDGFKWVRSFENGDALIETHDGVCLVMGLSLGTNDPAASEVCLIKVGEKSYATAPGEYRKVEAFANVGLGKEETDVMNRVVAACVKAAAAVTVPTPSPSSASTLEFENSLRRASDSNPFIQYQVARAYLEGKGTAKDEKLGIEWMNKAAKNGSGDAHAFLEATGSKNP